jgi:hypothetical protein
MDKLNSKQKKTIKKLNLLMVKLFTIGTKPKFNFYPLIKVRI